jgi:uncharacterized membrane protein (UPF0136 family)
MSTNDISAASIIVFSLLIFFGGIIVFTKVKIKASLIAGIVSTVLLFWFAKTTHHNAERGILRTFLVIALLEGIFVVRLVKTKKFMPAGLMLILCALEQVFLIWNSSHI